MQNLVCSLTRLRARIERKGGGGHDGEDLCQEVALACMEKRDAYDWSHPVVPGRIIRIAKNLHAKSLRRQRLRKHSPLPSGVCLALATIKRLWTHGKCMLRQTALLLSTAFPISMTT